MLDVSQAFAGRRVLFVGATGFVGKVALGMLLDRYPEIGKVFVLVRPGAGSTSEQRFFGKVAASPVFDPIRAQHGDGFDAFLRDRCVPLPGDAARPDLNFSADDFARFGKIDLLINCAGLVSFSPSLETALRINTQGVRYVRDVARKIGAGVVHVSTCFVAGNRSGEIWEDEPVAGYYPRRGELRDADFDVDAELADCERTILQVKALADDRAHVSMFRDAAARRLRDEGRDPDDEKTLRIAVARERKLWVSQRLTELGMERAQHWGWPNIYTYSKSLGDQVLATATDVRSALVRPSIVESALRFPFPGWNEGFTTSAPLVFLGLKGHRTYPAHPKAMLDVVPVDLLAAVIVGAGAAVISGQNAPVYHASTSDSAPLPVPRATELTSLYVRRHWKDREAGSRLYNELRARLEMVPSSKARFNGFSAPAWKGVAQTAQRWIDELTPRWGAPRLTELAAGVKSRLAEVERMAARVDDAFQLFMPFIHDNHYVFRSDNVRALRASLAPADAAKLVWDPENIEWRDYWLRVHLPGLKKWVFPNLEEEFKARPRSVYQYKELVELFEAATKLHRSRVAMRQLPPPGSDEPIRRITYRELGEHARRGAAHLAAAGVTTGDRVLLVAENCPEWGMSFFGVMLLGAVVVPVDHQAGLGELANLVRASGAKAIVASDRVVDRLGGPAALGAKLFTFGDLFAQPAASPAPEASPRGDDLASLLYTSGTTGNPKGVMLSHRNFTSLLAKLLAVFDLKPYDRLLSVLPLHHTFEFTAGFLMPLARGAQITYLHEVNPDAISGAFDEGDTTAMIGVPALWQLLHRRMKQTIGERGPWMEELFDVAVEGARRVREATGINLGRVAFARVHKEMGGRIRLMVSGGSALAPEVMKAFHGLGFSLYEGYGLTEASPVLAVQRPGTKIVPGSVGEALPGIEIRIDQPDASGVGEVVASGPNVMAGYYENADATREVLDGSWLRTGDLGRLDEEKRLYIVGRKKEMILAANGENVYPDELEELYRESPLIKELSVVGLPEDGGVGETVACLLVPNYEGGERADVRARVQEHVREVAQGLPPAKRIKVLHLWEHDLPRTSTRKVKRRLVVDELKKLQRAVAHAEEQPIKAAGGDWVLDLVARVAARPRERVSRETRLGELGVDSLMAAELAVALETAGVAVEEQDLLQGGVDTVGALAELVAARQKKARARLDKPRSVPAPVADELPVAAPLAFLGRKVLRWGQRMTYERFFDTKVTGQAYLPRRAPFIVAANHASHLDMGLVKHALGDWGELLVALAAKDYFFEDRLKRAYFENFTNLVPMDRSGSLRESLRLAARVLAEGRVLLIFPEGTRSPDGVMRDFKASVGYLALANKVDVVPMYLDGTYDALPKGAAFPVKRTIGCKIGPLLSYETLRAGVEDVPRAEHNRAAARLIEASVRSLGGLSS